MKYVYMTCTAFYRLTSLYILAEIAATETQNNHLIYSLGSFLVHTIQGT